MRKISRLVQTTLGIVCMAVLSLSQAPGNLDPTFGNGGKVTDFISRADDWAIAIAIQPDGKIVVAGSTHDDFAVARYNADGSLDTTFGTGGKVTTDISSSYDSAYAVAIQQDGKIVVVGVGNSDFALVRYNSDGSLDTSFGASGKVTTDFTGYDGASSVAIQMDGKIVAAGGSYYVGGTDFALARYNPNGSLDTSFDGDGKVKTDIFNLGDDRAEAVAIHPNGKIVAAGYAYSQAAARYLFTLVQYNVDGSLDGAFDGDGKVATQVGSLSSAAHSVAIQADGRILAAGGALPGYGGFGFALVRYDSNGSPENVVTTQFTNDTANSIQIQPDGKIVAAGPSGSNFAVVRFNADFSIDTTFGTNGRVTTPIGSYGGACGLAVQTDGKIVGAGNIGGTDFDADFAVVRFNANGPLDSSFDGDGTVTTDFGLFQGNELHDTAIQPDGKIVAAGTVRAEFSRTDFVLLRYNPDGSPDTTFGSGTGKVHTDLFSYDDARAVAIQPDGRIVVAGSASDQDDNECCFALARYNVDGSLDATFGSVGKVITGGWGNSGGANDVVIQPDGKVVAAGYSNEVNWPNGGFAVYRYNPNGSLDTSFDGDGRVITPIGSSYAVAASVTLQPDGKVVAAGRSEDGSGIKIAVVRYNGNGSLDTTFDGDGIVTTQTSQQDAAYSSVIQPDGKIIVAGFPSIVRYYTSGSLDSTFGSGGVVTTQVGSGYVLRAVAMLPDGKIVASGYTNGVTGNSGDFALVRYRSDGSLDSSLGDPAIRTVDFETSYDLGFGMALDTAGRAVIVGTSDGRFALARLIPDAPSVSVSGRVLTATGAPIRNAIVTITDPFGSTRSTITSTFGTYSFDEVAAGQTYTLVASAKRYRFQPLTVAINDNSSSVDLIANPSEQ